MPRQTSFVLAVLLFTGMPRGSPLAQAAPPAGAAQGEREVPKLAEVQRAKQSIRDTMKIGAGGPAAAERPVLARRLVKEANEIDAARDAARRYACFDLACEYGEEAGDLEAAMAAVDALAETFKVDVLPLKFATYTATAKAAKPDEPLIAAGLALLADALAAERYQPLQAFGVTLESLARKAGRPALVSLVGGASASPRPCDASTMGTSRR